MAKLLLNANWFFDFGNEIFLQYFVIYFCKFANKKNT